MRNERRAAAEATVTAINQAVTPTAAAYVAKGVNPAEARQRAHDDLMTRLQVEAPSVYDKYRTALRILGLG